MAEYTEEHARAGIDAKMPELETFPNQYRTGYEISIEIPEYTSVCPKTGLPDHGTIRIRYEPDRKCVELKSLKMYILAYRNLGIFYENAVNKICLDLAKALKPKWLKVVGDFNPRGGIKSVIEVEWPKKRSS